MDYITKLIPCVTFMPATSSSPNYVTIYPGTKCQSEVGMRGGDQAMYLNSACFNKGLIGPVHELMHTLGFVHEHTRTLVLAGSWFCHNPFWSCSKRLVMILEAQAIPLNTILRLASENLRDLNVTKLAQIKNFFVSKLQNNFIPKLIFSLLNHNIYIGQDGM